jgi:hypothetical protein
MRFLLRSFDRRELVGTAAVERLGEEVPDAVVRVDGEAPRVALEHPAPGPEHVVADVDHRELDGDPLLVPDGDRAARDLDLPAERVAPPEAEPRVAVGHLGAVHAGELEG